MASATFTQTQIIRAPVEAILTMLQYLELSTRYHPLVIAITLVEAVDLPEGGTRRTYHVTDRVAIGPLRMKTAYTAIMTRPAAEPVVLAEAIQPPGVRLHIRYLCVTTSEAVEVRETTTVEAPRAMLGFVTRQAADAHRETLKDMGAVLEADVLAGIALPGSAEGPPA